MKARWKQGRALGSEKAEVMGTRLLAFDAQEISLDWIVWTKRGAVLISKQVVRIFTIVISKI
jgi:hypothetical protein